MAQRLIEPLAQVLDDAGVPREGARLFFYESGTSTKANTYSDSALSTPNTNPIELNEFGQPSVDVWGQNIDYKLVLAGPDALGTDDPPTNVIRTFDPVRTSDFKSFFKAFTGSGNPNGSVAGTAGSSGVLPDTYWDYTNLILYICSTTGTSSTAVWTAINANASTPSVPPPQGRLTAVSSTPILTTDANAVTSIYFTPATGNLVPIYNGASMTPTEFAELTLTLVSQHAPSTIYDLFVFSNSGVLTLITGPAWLNSGAGTGDRGTGASTTQLSRVKGLYVNAVQIAGRNGTSTYTIGANLATYVGSAFIDGSAGVVSCHLSYGQARKLGIWNAYNRHPVLLKMGDATASWTTAPTTWRQSRADTSNKITVFSGLAEEVYDLQFSQLLSLATNNTTSRANIGIGVNSTTTPSGRIGEASFSNTTTSVISMGNTLAAHHSLAPAIGIYDINALERAPSGTTNNQFSGTESNMMMTAKWRA